LRHWLAANLPPELYVDDAADQRIAPDRDVLDKRIAWQKVMNAAGWVGIGMTWEHDLQLYLKRAKAFEIAFGDAAWHRERVARLITP
jgi:hypothetical protein